MAQHDEEKMGEITGVQDVNELQAELARVKAENEELRRSQEEAGAQAAMEAGPSTWTRMRQPLAMVLIVLAVLAAPLAVTAVWIQTDVLSTDGWVATVGPLAKEPSIQTAVATYATDSLFKAVDVQVYVGQLLPDKAKVLAAPISTAVENFIAKQAQALTHSPRFANLWVQANRTGHAAIVRLLSGEGRLSPGPAGAVQLDLGPMIGQIVSKLQGTGLNVFQSLPVSTAGQFTLFQSDALAQFQSAIAAINKLAYALPILVVLFAGAALGLARDRRRALLWLGMLLAVAMVLPLAALLVARSQSIAAVGASSTFSTTAVGAAWDIIFRDLRLWNRLFATLGLVVAIGAALAGPSAFATKLRDSVSHGLSGIGSTWNFGAFGAWIAAHKQFMRGLGLAGAVVALMVWSAPTPWTIVWIAVGFVVWLLLVEFFGRPPLQKDSSPSATQGGPT